MPSVLISPLDTACNPRRAGRNRGRRLPPLQFALPNCGNHLASGPLPARGSPPTRDGHGMDDHTKTPDPAESSVRDPSSTHRSAILVVDDDPTFCAIMAEILRMYSAQVYTASSAKEAMAILENVTPDLILTDVMMPEVDGLTFVRRIRSGGSLAKVRIIIVSARVSRLERAAALQAGADQFLAKPFSIIDLRAAVGQLLPN